MNDRALQQRQRREIGSGALPRLLGPVLRVAGIMALRTGVPIGAMCALSAAGMLVYASIEGVWKVAMFEGVVVCAGVVAVLTGMRRFAQGPAMALLCAGTAIGSLAVLSEPVLVSRLLGTQGSPLMIGGFKILPLMSGRVVAGVLLVLCAAIVVWGRDGARSAGYMIRSGLAGGAALLIVALGLWRVPESGARSIPLGLLDHIAALLASLPLLVQVLLVIGGFFLVVGLVSASGHCLIRSFEVGRLEIGDTGSEKGRAGGAPSANAPGA